MTTQGHCSTLALSTRHKSTSALSTQHIALEHRDTEHRDTLVALGETERGTRKYNSIIYYIGESGRRAGEN